MILMAMLKKSYLVKSRNKMLSDLEEYLHVYVCVCVCVCVRACVRACMRACMHVYVRACVCTVCVLCVCCVCAVCVLCMCMCVQSRYPHTRTCIVQNDVQYINTATSTILTMPFQKSVKFTVKPLKFTNHCRKWKYVVDK